VTSFDLFDARFNHDTLHVVSTWFQLSELWMSKYLTPKCFHDLMMESDPYSRVNVHKTGNNLSTMVKNCVKFVVLAVVPVDDVEVIAAVNAWPDEVHFAQTVGRLCDLTKVSKKYVYNTKKINKGELSGILTDKPYRKDFDAIIRPTLEGFVRFYCMTVLRVMTSCDIIFDAFRLGVPFVPSLQKAYRSDHLRTDGQCRHEV
jgi:hypothetical protein